MFLREYLANETLKRILPRGDPGLCEFSARIIDLRSFQFDAIVGAGLFATATVEAEVLLDRDFFVRILREIPGV